MNCAANYDLNYVKDRVFKRHTVKATPLWEDVSESLIHETFFVRAMGKVEWLPTFVGFVLFTMLGYLLVHGFVRVFGISNNALRCWKIYVANIVYAILCFGWY